MSKSKSRQDKDFFFPHKRNNNNNNTMMKQIAFFLALASSASAIHLTPDNWDAETAGKTIFVKFYAPW